MRGPPTMGILSWHAGCGIRKRATSARHGIEQNQLGSRTAADEKPGGTASHRKARDLPAHLGIPCATTCSQRCVCAETASCKTTITQQPNCRERDATNCTNHKHSGINSTCKLRTTPLSTAQIAVRVEHHAKQCETRDKDDEIHCRRIAKSHGVLSLWPMASPRQLPRFRSQRSMGKAPRH